LILSTANGGTSSAISYLAGTSAGSGANDIANNINAAANSIGITAVATNSVKFGNILNAGTVSFTLNGSAVNANVTSTTDLTTLAAAINGTTNTTKVTATFANQTDKSQLTLTTTDGSDIVVVDFLNSAGGTARFGEPTGALGQNLTSGTTDSSRAVGVVTLASSKGAITTTAAVNEVFANNGTQSSVFNGVMNVDLSSQANASAALGIIDSALTQVNNTRAALGGLINRFEATVSNQNTTIMNLSASRSRILDTDYAVETTNLAKAQIIQQAATAMLAQANQSSQSVLALLK